MDSKQFYAKSHTIGCININKLKGPFKCYVTQMGVGGVTFSGKQCYEGVRFNVISVTRALRNT